jgi:hypothetical protein
MQKIGKKNSHTNMNTNTEKDTVVPAGRSTRYPKLNTLKIGSDYFVSERKIKSVWSILAGLQRKTGKKFKARTEGNGVRVWRIK